MNTGEKDHPHNKLDYLHKKEKLNTKNGLVDMMVGFLTKSSPEKCKLPRMDVNPLL